jgi:hypothetical protein
MYKVTVHDYMLLYVITFNCKMTTYKYMWQLVNVMEYLWTLVTVLNYKMIDHDDMCI